MMSKRAGVLAGAAVLAVAAGTVYVAGAQAAQEKPAGKSDTPEKIDSRVVKESDDLIQIELADKRRVLLSYENGEGLVERHRRAGGDWSAPKTVHRTKTDHCQGIDARAHGSTVTVTADWGTYCSDGEPPMESLAAVGTGHLTDWDTDLTEGFDGWPPAKIYDDGDRAEFVDKRWDGTTTLIWDKGSGFREKSDVYKPIPERFTGSWRSEDGTHRLTFEQAAPGRRPSLTIETLKGQRCLGSGAVTKKSGDSVELRDFKVKEGKETANCPPELYETFFTAESADGPLKQMELGKPPKPLVTYERVGGGAAR